MRLERDYKTRLTVTFGDKQPTLMELMARPPFLHNKKQYEELKGQTERPREQERLGIISKDGDLTAPTAPINKSEPDQTEDKQEKGGQNIGAHASTLSKYEGSQPLGDMVRLVYILYHLVDQPNQNDVEHHTPPKLLDREEFPRLVLQTREPDPCILTLLPDHVGTTECLEDKSIKILGDTTTKLQPTKEVSFNDKDHVRYFTQDTIPRSFDHEEQIGFSTSCPQLAPALSCTLPLDKVVDLEVDLGVDMMILLLKINNLLEKNSTH